MNAYELAKQLEERHAPYEDDAANMLRQQADRIAELEKQGEPVAWMFQGAFDISTYVSFDKPNPYIYPNPTPLYTAPQTKPLSDEEIWEVWQEVVNSRHAVTGQIKPFARAIEERHGIK